MAEQNRLTDAEFIDGNIWLKHVFFPLAKDEIADDCYGWDYSGIDFEEVRPQAKEIYAFIKDQLWDEDNKLDACLNRFAGIKYSDRPLGTFNDGRLIQFTAEQLARIIINLCYNCNIFWDNASHTKQEIEYFEKTIFGKTIKELDCYIVSEVAQVSKPAAPRAPRNSAPTGGFRARGPLSDQAIGLIGQPHDKINLANCYKIVDKYAQTKKQTRLFIRPISQKWASNGVNKVIYGDSNNWGDCTCLFDERSSAETFKANFLRLAAGSGNQQLNLDVVTEKLDTNGYFKLATNCGNCYIRADGLNEELAENISVSPVKKLDRETLEQFMQDNRD